MRPLTLTLLTGLLFTPTTLAAQSPRTIDPGVRIRISAHDLSEKRLVGTVLRVRADTLVLAVEDRPTSLAVSLPSVTKLEVSQGRVRGFRGRGVLRGAGIGAGAGAAIGLIVDLAQEDEQAESPVIGALMGSILGAVAGGGGRPAIKGAGYGYLVGALSTLGLGMAVCGDNDCGTAWLVGSIAFWGPVGAFTGAVIGSAVGTERWEPVSVDRFRFGAAPSKNGGLTLAASLDF